MLDSVKRLLEVVNILIDHHEKKKKMFWPNFNDYY